MSITEPVHPSPEGPTRAPGERVRIRAWRPSDVAELVGSAGSALAITWLLFFQLTTLYGSPGFVIVSLGLFVPIYWLVQREAHGTLVARDRVATVVISIGGLVTILPLVWILVTVVAKGIEFLTPRFFVEDMSVTGPLDGPESGGALHAIIGTLMQVGIAIVISVPLGIMTAVYLNEVRGRLRRVVRMFVDAMSGLPSIVAGLFIYAVLVLQYGYSGFAAGLSLAILMLPSVTRTSEEMLRLVPDGLREASLALGAPEWRTALMVVLPTARVGLVTAVILGTARAVGETAPVLLTALGSKSLNLNPFSGPQDNLPLFVYDQVRSSVDNSVSRGWTGALVLVMLVLILFTAARLVAGQQGTRRLSSVVFWRRKPRQLPTLPDPTTPQPAPPLHPDDDSGGSP